MALFCDSSLDSLRSLSTRRSTSFLFVVVLVVVAVLLLLFTREYSSRFNDGVSFAPGWKWFRWELYLLWIV